MQMFTLVAGYVNRWVGTCSLVSWSNVYSCIYLFIYLFIHYYYYYYSDENPTVCPVSPGFELTTS